MAGWLFACSEPEVPEPFTYADSYSTDKLYLGHMVFTDFELPVLACHLVMWDQETTPTFSCSVACSAICRELDMVSTHEKEKEENEADSKHRVRGRLLG